MLAINFLVCVVYVWAWVLCGVREFEGGCGGSGEREFRVHDKTAVKLGMGEGVVSGSESDQNERQELTTLQCC